MAATVSFTDEIPAKVSASRMFEEGVVHFPDLLPILVPEYLKSAAVVHGDGKAGSVKLYTFAEGTHYSTIKERIDILDKEKMEAQYTVLEGGHLGTKTTTVVYKIKVVPGAGDDTASSVFIITAEYKLLPGMDYTKEMESDKIFIRDVVAAVEKHLLEQ